MTLIAPCPEPAPNSTSRWRTLAAELCNMEGSDARARLAALLRELAETEPDLIQQVNASIELRRIGVCTRRFELSER